MNSKMKSGTPVKDHMLKLMGYFAEAQENGANLEPKIRSEMVFSSLSKEFTGFKAAYNLGDKELDLTSLMKQLMSYEMMMNGGKQVVGEAHLAVASSSGSKRSKKKKQAKGSKMASTSKPTFKARRKRDSSKVRCFFCEKKGHYKRDCPEFKKVRKNVDGKNSK
jgi:gag-polypeptide of LTR copia-type/Zinc knuckle